MSTTKEPNKIVRAVIFDASKESCAEIHRILTEEKISVEQWFHSGKGWEKTLENLKPDLVIVDLQLPHFDGLTVIQRVMGQNNQVRIVFTHSYNSELGTHVELQSMQVGARSVCQKPFTDPRLLASVYRSLK